jgi:hypothetical protein
MFAGMTNRQPAIGNQQLANRNTPEPKQKAPAHLPQRHEISSLVLPQPNPPQPGKSPRKITINGYAQNNNPHPTPYFTQRILKTVLPKAAPAANSIHPSILSMNFLIYSNDDNQTVK